jgi:prolyl-tRNA editing enzyme YbaK/EbsC (Cys-tRNA(Pro) deacylase)
VIVDAAIDGGKPVAIGAGAHGVNLHVDPAALFATLHATVVDVSRRDGAT